MFSPHGAMSVMRHWEFTLVLDNSGASVGMSLGQSGTENKMQNNHLSYTIQRTLGKREAHHGPAISRFLVSNGSTNGAGCLRVLLGSIKTHFENISGCPF